MDKKLTIIYPSVAVYCKKCGIIIDIDIKCPNMKKILSDGHKVDEIQGYFKGICKDCLKMIYGVQNES